MGSARLKSFRIRMECVSSHGLSDVVESAEVNFNLPNILLDVTTEFTCVTV
jgi:hypothetical protein